MAVEKIGILKYAFAQNGDRKEFSIDSDSGGEMSWEAGYPLPYALNPELDGKYIQRETFNNLIYQITKILKHQQINNGMLWDADNAAMLGGYPAGARVLVYYDLRTNQITDQAYKAGNYPVYSTVVLVSMVDNNMYSPFDENSLFKFWYIDDGNDLFGVKISTQNPTSEAFKVPSGYIDFGFEEPTKVYSYEDYPRVKYFRDTGSLPSYIQDQGGSGFKLVDIRGRFFRVFSNGATIDSGRTFNVLQSHAMQTLYGEVAIMDDNAWNNRSNTYQSMYNISALYPKPGGGVYGIKRESTEEAKIAYSTPATYTTGINAAAAGFPVTTHLGNVLTFDNRNSVNTANENRPDNFNIKMYIKV